MQKTAYEWRISDWSSDVCSSDLASAATAVDACRAGLIEPVLIGPRARLLAVAAEAGLAIDGMAIEDVPHSHAAAQPPVELAVAGPVDVLMKGSLHTDTMMGALIGARCGLSPHRQNGISPRRDRS